MRRAPARVQYFHAFTSSGTAAQAHSARARATGVDKLRYDGHRYLFMFETQSTLCPLTTEPLLLRCGNGRRVQRVAASAGDRAANIQKF